MEQLTNILAEIDSFVWGPAMLFLLVGTGIFLTIRLKFRPWINLGYAIKNTLSKDARTTKGVGDISPFSALMTALASTIGTGNIVGVATAMVAGGPGALVWMWISAFFGLSSKFSECMLSIKYREVNEKGEMSGGPMYTMKKGFKNPKIGTLLGWLFAFFTVIASFGIGNMTQANSISDSLHNTFGVSVSTVGIILTVLALIIIVGGIQTISKVSSVLVPAMAIFYMLAGLVVILINIKNVPSGVAMIFKMAFSLKSVGGGLCGSITASIMNSMRFGIARGVFSNEAGMGSAAITAAAATTDSPVQQGYINMTGTFWDTIVVCTITGLCIASSGVLGATEVNTLGTYAIEGNMLSITASTISDDKPANAKYTYEVSDNSLVLTDKNKNELSLSFSENSEEEITDVFTNKTGIWRDTSGNEYIFSPTGAYEYSSVIKGAPLTIKAFESALGKIGGFLVSIGITLFAFSTILGWEYNGEKSLEYLLKTHKFNMLYRIFFSFMIYVGATTALDIVWSFSDIANALMSVPNLISLLVLSNVIAKDVEEYQPEIEAVKNKKAS